MSRKDARNIAGALLRGFRRPCLVEDFLELGGIKEIDFIIEENQILYPIEIKKNGNLNVGIVGLNGCGKTTFMNLIAHRLIPDSGKILWDKNKTFSYLDQMLVVNSDITITEYLYSVYNNLFQKEREMNALYESMAEANESDYDRILNKAEKINQIKTEFIQRMTRYPSR